MTAKELGNSKVEFDGYEPNGLTKRELFAYGVMKSLVLSEAHNGASFYDISWICSTAIKIADALLEELAKEE